ASKGRPIWIGAHGRTFAPALLTHPMSRNLTTPSDLFSEREIARVAGVSPAAVRELILRRRVPALHGYVEPQQAVRCVRLLRREMAEMPRKGLFAPPAHGEHSA